MISKQLTELQVLKYVSKHNLVNFFNPDNSNYQNNTNTPNSFIYVIDDDFKHRFPVITNKPENHHNILILPKPTKILTPHKLKYASFVWKKEPPEIQIYNISVENKKIKSKLIHIYLGK